MAFLQRTVHLSQLQKELLAKVKAAPNPKMAFEIISSAERDIDDNFASARQTLEKLNIISNINDTLQINNEEILKDEGITDDSGELTDYGRELASKDRNEANDQTPTTSDTLQTSDQDNLELDVDMDMDMNQPKSEQFDLIQLINDQSKLFERK